MAVLHENGSIIFCYKQFSYPFVGSGLVGIRPFYRYSNYSTRSAYLSSGGDDWYFRFFHVILRDTSLIGNYLRVSRLTAIHRKLQSSQSFLFDDVAFFFLAPTELCVTPSVILQNVPTNITLSFSWLDPQLPEAYLRCGFGAMIVTPVMYVWMSEFIFRRISAYQLRCVTPNFMNDDFVGSQLYLVSLSFMS